MLVSLIVIFIVFSMSALDAHLALLLILIRTHRHPVVHLYGVVMRRNPLHCWRHSVSWLTVVVWMWLHVRIWEVRGVTLPWKARGHVWACMVIHVRVRRVHGIGPIHSGVGVWHLLAIEWHWRVHSIRMHHRRPRCSRLIIIIRPYLRMLGHSIARLPVRWRALLVMLVVRVDDSRRVRILLLLIMSARYWISIASHHLLGRYLCVGRYKSIFFTIAVDASTISVAVG